MGILLGFAPFIAFAVLTRFATPTVSLWAAAIASAVLVIRERLRGRSLKILEVGTLALFLMLGFYSSFIPVTWDIPTVRAIVDAGLLFIIILSIVVRNPFTLQYAREQVSAETLQSPTFVRTNYVLTSIWAAAMAIIVVADLGMHFVPTMPLSTEVAAILVALGGAFWFTKWYPAQQRQRHKEPL